MFFIERDPFVALGKARIDMLHSLANNFLACGERFSELNLETTRTLLSDSASSHPTHFADSDFSATIKWHADLSRQLALKGVSYTQEMLGIGKQCQQGLSSVFEDLLAEFNQGAAQALDKVNAGPAASETGIAAVKAAIAALNSTYENMSEAGKQAVDSIDANMNAVAETFGGSGQVALPQPTKSRSRKALDEMA